MTEITQPYSESAEKAVVGSILINPNAYYDIDVDLEPYDFYIRRYGRVFELIKAMMNNAEPVDVLTVSNKFTDDDSKLGVDILLLSKLCDEIPTTFHITEYARIVREKATRRNLIENARRLTKIAYDETSDVINDVTGVLVDIENVSASMDNMTHISAYTSLMMMHLDDMMAHPKKVWGLESGFAEWDNITGGFQPGEVFVLSGESGVGKSLIAGQVAVTLAKQAPGAYYSLEMSGEAIARRMVSGYAGVNTNSIKTGSVDGASYDLLKEWSDYTAGLPLFINKKQHLTLGELQSSLAALRRKENIKWFVLDYLMLLTIRGMDEIEMTTEVSKLLKNIAMKLDLSCILIHSHNKIGQLRGSGQLKYNVDVHLRMERDDDIKDNGMRKFTFDKGREIPSDNSHFILYKAPNYPYFKSTTSTHINLAHKPEPVLEF